MVATPAAIKNEPGADALEMTALMEELAAAGDWQRVRAIAAKLCDIMPHIPQGERRQVLQSARRSTDKVQSLARFASREVTDKLSAIRRGRDATRAYASFGGVASPGPQP